MHYIIFWLSLCTLTTPLSAITLKKYLKKIGYHPEINPLQTVAMNDGTRLDLANKSLTSLKGISNLQVIYKDKIISIKGVPDLILNLQFNNLQNLPQEIANLTNVNELWLSDNKLRTLVDLTSFNRLSKLILYYNDLRFLPSWIQYLENLKELDVSFNILTEIPKVIVKLAKLESLCLEANYMEGELPTILGMKHLDYLNILYNNFDPEHTGHLLREFLKLHPKATYFWEGEIPSPKIIEF